MTSRNVTKSIAYVDSVQQTSFSPGKFEDMRPGEYVLAAEIRRVWGGKVTVLVQQEIRKRMDWGRSRKDCGFCQMQGGKPPVKKKKRNPALSQAFTRQNSSQSKSRRRMRCGIYGEKGWMSRALQKGWNCKAKELCLSARRPLLFFLCPFGDINSRLR